MSVSPLSSALVLFTALTLTACVEPDPVAPNAAQPDASLSASLSHASGESDHVTRPVTFTIPGGTCGLATTITGNGVLHRVTRSHQSREGVWHVGFHESANGTASGADGSRYTFDYAITARSVNPTGANDFAVIDIVDYFILRGRGKAPDMKVFIQGRFTYPAFEPIGTPVVRGPGIACDPI